MPEIALYYPYVSPRDESWVKQALLFWPRIQRIVPEDYPVKDTPMLQRLVDEKVLTNVLPDVGASGLANSFIDFVSEHAPTLRGLYSVEQAGMLPARICRHLDLDPGLNWIHTGKLDPAATRALVSSGLAVPNTLEPSWLGMHPALADVYMCGLAGEMSRLAGGTTRPVTDEALHHVGAYGWSIPAIARALLPDLAAGSPKGSSTPGADGQATVIALAVRTLTPRNLGSIPVERILDLRRRYASDFDRYRERVGALANEVAQLEGVRDTETLAQHVEIRYEQTLGRELTELRNVLRSQKFDVVDTALAFRVAAPSTLIGAGVTELAGAAVGAGAATAIAAISAARGMVTRLRAAMEPSSAAWLVRIEENLAPGLLAGYLRSSLTRFAS